MRWACLFLPQLALDGVLRRTTAPDAAVALVHGPVQRRVLHSVNPAARACGLRPGMALTAVQALGVQCRLADYDPREAERWRDLVAAWAYGYSSQVSTALPHAVVLEVGRSLRLFGPWPQFAQRLRDELHALGFRHRLVAAPNPYAARVLANVHDALSLDDHALPAALGHLPLGRAGLPREISQAFARMGLRQLRQVLALPRASLTRRFPPELLHHLDRLQDPGPPLLEWYRPPDRFESRIEFEYDVESNQALLFPLRRLTADLAAYLCGRDGGVQRFSLWLEHERTSDTEVVVGLLAPERDAAMLFELARGRLEQARTPAPVRGMRLLAEELPRFVPSARDLFDTRPQQAVPWVQLRERLRARLGDDAVSSLGWRADHRPERTVCTDPAQHPSTPPAVPRPGWLLPQPQPLRGLESPPLSGPERIESGWWDDEDVRRDYYIVETPQGQQAWVYRAITDDGDVAAPAMLHGWFA